jgi:hypothetical protein
MHTFVIMVRDTSGLVFYGTFETEDAAAKYGEAEIGSRRFWLVIPVQPK